MTLEEDFEPLRTFVHLQVAVKALANITVDKAEVSKLYLTEGQGMNVSCSAERVFPRPVFRWSLSRGSGIDVVLLHEQVAYLDMTLQHPYLTFNMRIDT